MLENPTNHLIVVQVIPLSMYPKMSHKLQLIGCCNAFLSQDKIQGIKSFLDLQTRSIETIRASIVGRLVIKKICKKKNKSPLGVPLGGP